MELTDRINETRKALSEKGNELLEQVKTRRDELVGQAEGRAEEIKQQATEALDTGRGRFVVMEARALEQARELLGRAGAILGERAPFVAKAETALTDALVQIRAQHEMALPVEDFQELSIKKVRPFLADLDAEDLRVLRTYEVEHKNRVTLLRAIDKRLEELATA